jgi:hypothetical protein
VSQWEAAEREGRIKLGTLRRAMAAMGRDLAVYAPPRRPVREAFGDWGVFDGLPKAGRGRERCVWRARRRVRTAAIAYDALADGAPFDLADLWVLAEGITVATRDTAGVQRVWEIRGSYNQAVRAAEAPAWRPAAHDSQGRPIPHRHTPAHPVAAHLGWAADQIANGVDPIWARHAANTAILRDGFDWIMLGPEDAAEHRHAIGQIKAGGDATPFFELMAARYDEAD